MAVETAVYQNCYLILPKRKYLVTELNNYEFDIP